MKAVVYFIYFCILFIVSCNNEGKNAKADSGNCQDSVKKNEILLNSIDSNCLFLKNNYLKIDEILSGPVYLNEKDKNFFFRVIKFREEEHILLFIEKISLGDEGGNFHLIKRYRLKENMLFLPDYALNSADSLSFKDSVTLIGHLNNFKYEINLENIKAKKK